MLPRPKWMPECEHQTWRSLLPFTVAATFLTLSSASLVIDERVKFPGAKLYAGCTRRRGRPYGVPVGGSAPGSWSARTPIISPTRALRRRDLVALAGGVPCAEEERCGGVLSSA